MSKAEWKVFVKLRKMIRMLCERLGDTVLKKGGHEVLCSHLYVYLSCNRTHLSLQNRQPFTKKDLIYHVLQSNRLQNYSIYLFPEHTVVDEVLHSIAIDTHKVQYSTLPFV